MGIMEGILLGINFDRRFEPFISTKAFPKEKKVARYPIALHNEKNQQRDHPKARFAQ
jgi:hypothetical protein